MICEQIAPPEQSYKVIGILILIIVLEIVAVEIWAKYTKHPAITKFFQHFTRKWRIFFVFVFSTFVWIAWHLTFGGPL